MTHGSPPSARNGRSREGATAGERRQTGSVGRLPLGSELLGSFEAWAATLGGILANAGVPGFLANQASHQSRSDTESEAWTELVWFWWNKWGPTEVRATAVADLCKEHDLLTDIRGSGSDRSVVSRVGRALASAEDRFFGDYQLVRNPRNGGGSSLYRLVRVVNAKGVDEDGRVCEKCVE